MAFHDSTLEVSNVLLATVLIREPMHLTMTVKPALTKLSLVEDSSGFLSELTTGKMQ